MLSAFLSYFCVFQDLYTGKVSGLVKSKVVCIFYFKKALTRLLMKGEELAVMLHKNYLNIYKFAIKYLVIYQLQL